MVERDDLSVLEDPGATSESPKVWVGGAIAVVVLVVLTMVALGVLVLVIWALSLLLSLGVPTLPGPLF